MKKKKKMKKEVSEMGEKGKNHIKSRRMQDRLFMVVTAQIYGKPVHALIDSGATRCFVTPAYVAVVGLKRQPHDTILELGSG